MDVLWHSNAPWVCTGYGVQTRLVTKRLADDGHRVAVSCFFGLQGSAINWNGLDCYPALMHNYGIDAWDHHAQRHGGDDCVIISLIDAWVLEKPRHFWAGWLPVDHEPVPPPVAAKAAQMGLAIAMSEFGQRMLADAGVSAAYAPHGVDPSDYYPDADLAAKAREWLRVPDKATLFSVVAANKGGWPSRKNIANIVEGFAKALGRGADAYLYLHTYSGEDGAMGSVNVPELLRHLDVAPDRVRLIPPAASIWGETTEYMRGIYSASDALVNVAMGEGFGVPILEAQACGCPVVVGRWTAMAEVAGQHSGVFVEKAEAQPFWSPQAGRMWIAGSDVIADALVEVSGWRGSKRAKSLRSAAVAHAAAYDADAVHDRYWRPVMERIAELTAKTEPRVEVAS